MENIANVKINLHNYLQILIKYCHYEEPNGVGDEVIQPIYLCIDKILHLIFLQC